MTQKASVPSRCFSTRLNTAAGLLFAFFSAGSAVAQNLPPVKVTELTSFHYNGESIGDEGGRKGWPSLQRPTAPPLLAAHPASQRYFLFGGSVGENTVWKNVGLWWMPAAPGHYQRLEVSANRVYGTIPGTPVMASTGHIYGVIASSYNLSRFTRNFSDDGIDCSGSHFAACIAMDRYTPPGQPVSDIRYFSDQHSGIVGQGLVFRTEFDGTHLEIVESTLGHLYLPNGVLVADAQDTLYGVDRGPSGRGRIFRLDRDGVLHTLHEFALAPNGKPQVPNGMILGTDGWLYGVSGYPRGLPGAPGTPAGPDTPVGAIYRLNPAAAVPSSTFQVLHTLRLDEGEINVDDNYSIGGARYFPSGELAHPGDLSTDRVRGTDSTNNIVGLNWLVEGPDGWLYGATSVPVCQTWSPTQGMETFRYVSMPSPLCGMDSTIAAQYGSPYPHYDGPVPHGALYRISKDGSSGLQLLHRFNDTDGSTPRGMMALGSDGAIYGTTASGGAYQHWEASASSWTTEEPPRRTCESFRSHRPSYNECMNWLPSPEEWPRLAYPRLPREGTLYRIVPGHIQVAGDGSVVPGNGGFEHLHSFKLDVDGRRPNGVQAGADGRLYGVTVRGGKGYVDERGVTRPADDNGAAFVVDLQGNVPDAAVNLTITPSYEIDVGERVTLTWTTYQARDCVANSSAKDWSGVVALEGSIELAPPSGSHVYRLQCVDTVKGTEVTGLATLYVNAPITNNDGNNSHYGNGGGGALQPSWLLLLALLGVVRCFQGGIAGGVVSSRCLVPSSHHDSKDQEKS